MHPGSTHSTMAKNLLRMFPDYLPNTYMQYYLLGDQIVKDSDKNHTRANEVMEGREKRIFQAVDTYMETGEIDMAPFFTGVHGEIHCGSCHDLGIQP